MEIILLRYELPRPLLKWGRADVRFARTFVHEKRVGNRPLEEAM